MILVSAFGRFDIDPENSTELALAEFLKGDPRDVAGIVLPVSFGGAWPLLKREIDRRNPRAVLALGQADGRTRITIEQVGLNWIDARLADADGAQPVDAEIEPGGPLAARSGLPTRALVARLREAGLDAELSYTAGTYVCNALMYALSRWSAASGVPAGFIHYPLLKEQRLGEGREAVRPGQRNLTIKEAARSLSILVEEMKTRTKRGG